MNKEQNGSDTVERVVVRKAFICIHCEGVYADVPVSQCDCLEGTGQDFIEGIITYRMEPNSIQESIKNNCHESVLVQGIISSEVERKAQQAFENTRNGMGFNSPNWNELAEQTKQIYRDFVIRGNRPRGLK